MDRRQFLGALGYVGAGALLGGGLLSACADSTPNSSAAPDLLDATFGYLPITDATPLLLADAEELYFEHGLRTPRPARYRSWPELTQALQRNLVDFTHLLMPLAIRLRFDLGIPLKVLAWTHTGGSALTVRNGITSVEGLAGGVVAIPHWFSIHNVIAQILLRQAQLVPETELDSDGSPIHEDHVHLLAMAPADMPRALESGLIDAFIVAEPFNARAELAGGGHILRFSSDVWRDHACCVLVASEQAVDERPETVQRAVDAIVAAQLLARHERPTAALDLSLEGGAYLNDSLEVVTRALQFYDPGAYPAAIRNVAWASERVGFKPFPYRSFTERLVLQMRGTIFGPESGFIYDVAPDRVHDELVDDRFVRDALQRLDPENTFGLAPGLRRAEEISA